MASTEYMWGEGCDPLSVGQPCDPCNAALANHVAHGKRQTIVSSRKLEMTEKEYVQFQLQTCQQIRNFSKLVNFKNSSHNFYFHV